MVYACTGPLGGKSCLAQAPAQPPPRKLVRSASRAGLKDTANELRSLRDELRFWSLEPCAYCNPDSQAIGTMHLQVLRVKTIFNGEAKFKEGGPVVGRRQARRYSTEASIRRALTSIEIRLREGAEAVKSESHI